MLTTFGIRQERPARVEADGRLEAGGRLAVFGETRIIRKIFRHIDVAAQIREGRQDLPHAVDDLPLPAEIGDAARLIRAEIDVGQRKIGIIREDRIVAVQAVDIPVIAEFAAEYRLVECVVMLEIGNRRREEILIGIGVERLKMERLGGEVIAIVHAG